MPSRHRSVHPISTPPATSAVMKSKQLDSSSKRVDSSMPKTPDSSSSKLDRSSSKLDASPTRAAARARLHSSISHLWSA